MRRPLRLLKPGEALAFVERHGIVLESSRGPVPSLAQAIAGEDLRGSWWGHARGREIFGATRAVRVSSDILVCRLINGKITYVHRRLWPALVHLADAFDRSRLDALREEHTASGAHTLATIPFPRWVPAGVRRAAENMSEAAARTQLGDWLDDRKTARRTKGG